MASNKNIIPQVGNRLATAASPIESHPGTNVSGSPLDSGGGNLTPRRNPEPTITTPMGASQPIGKSSTASGQKERETANPFSKSALTPTSPRLLRRKVGVQTNKTEQASPSYESSPDEVVEGKRKRKDKDEGVELQKKVVDDLQNLENLLLDTSKAIELLGSLARENANTKTEIKKVAHEMQSYARRLKADSLITFIRDLAEAKLNLKKIEEGYKIAKIQDMSQCTCRKERQATKEEVASTETYVDFQKIKRLSWEEDLYKNCEAKVGSPIKVEDDQVIVIAESTDKDMRKSIQKTFVDRYPDLAEATEEITSMEFTAKIGDNIKRRRIIKLVPTDSAGDLWRLIGKARDLALEAGSVKVTMHKTSAMDVIDMRRAIQCILSGTNIKVTLYHPPTPPPQPGTYAQRVRAETKQPRSYESQAIEVISKGTYNEVLQEVKKSLAGTEMTNQIKTVRSTKSGSLLLVLDKTTEDHEKISSQLKQTMGNCQVRAIGQKGPEKHKLIFVRDMDETVSKQEVQEAITACALKEGLTNPEFNVGEFRSNRNNTKTITVKAQKEVADALLKAAYIKLGISEGRVEERMEVIRCYRCWGYGHLAKNCEEPDRKFNCYKCGEPGHIAKDCVSGDYCPICKKEGHAAGGVGCRQKRKAVEKIRKASVSTPKKSATPMETAEQEPNEVVEVGDPTN